MNSLFSEKPPPALHSAGLLAAVPALFVLLAYLLSLAACSPAPPSDPKAEAFIVRTRSDFDRLEKNLLPALQQPNPSHSADRAVAAFFSDPETRAGRTDMGVAVLDPHMKYLAGRKLNGPGETDSPIETRLTDFSYLNEIFKPASSKIVQSILHYPDQKIYAVCGPLKKEKRLAGFVCLFYRADLFEKECGIGEKVFLAIDFGTR